MVQTQFFFEISVSDRVHHGKVSEVCDIVMMLRVMSLCDGALYDEHSGVYFKVTFH